MNTTILPRFAKQHDAPPPIQLHERESLAQYLTGNWVDVRDDNGTPRLFSNKTGQPIDGEINVNQTITTNGKTITGINLAKIDGDVAYNYGDCLWLNQITG